MARCRGSETCQTSCTCLGERASVILTHVTNGLIPAAQMIDRRSAALVIEEQDRTTRASTAGGGLLDQV